MKYRIQTIMLVLFSFVATKTIAANKKELTFININNREKTLEAPSAESYTWYLNGKLLESSTQTIPVAKAGEYLVVYENVNGEINQKSVKVSLNANGDIIAIFIIGDSTVQSYGASTYPFAGWGQVLQHFFDINKVSIHNRARGGRSSRSFYEEGLWNNVVNELDSGNYVFIQFGHNDRDASNDTRYTSPDSMKYFLRVYVNDSRKKGAIPVLVSPMSMNTGTRNVFTETGSDYRGVMLEVANSLNVPFIDLNKKSYNFYQEIGTEYASYFIHMGLEAGEFPNYPEGYSDTWTHYQEMGALAMARMITKEIEEKQTNIELAPLADALIPLYNVKVSLNNQDAGVATISGEYPAGATVTLKARLNDNNVLNNWFDSTANSTLYGNLVSFTMEARDYVFTGIVTDCFGMVNGTAAMDKCGVCTGGETGKNPCARSISCIDFCDKNANIRLILDEEDLYNLVISTDEISGAYISQPLNVTTTDTFSFAISYNNPTANESLNIYVDDSLYVSDLLLDIKDTWKVAEFSLYLEEGEHIVKIQTTSQSGGVLLDYLVLYSDNVTEIACMTNEEELKGAYNSSDSLIVIEAENFTDLKAGTNGTIWMKANMKDASSGRVVIAPAGTSYVLVGDAQSKAPVVKYNVRFPYTGNYSVWARIFAFGTTMDSYHLGLDGNVLIEKIDLYNSTNVYEEYTWMHVANKKLKVSSTRIQTLNVFCREPNLIIDKIILSLNASYSPEGYGPEQTMNPADTVVSGINDLTITNQELQMIVFPNPAQNQVRIEYNLTESNHVNINIVNINGQIITNLINNYQSSGKHEIKWNLNNSLSGIVPNGLYLITFQTTNSMKIQKVLIHR